MTGSAPSAAWVEDALDVDGVRLHFHRTGRRGATPLVLVHGLSDNGRCWARVASALGEHFDVVMPDARNHGRSATAATSPSLLVGDLAALISTLRLERPVLIGHSVGAHTAAVLATRSPGVVSRLVLEDPPWPEARQHQPDELATQRREEVRSWLASFDGLTHTDLEEAGRVQHADWPDDEFPSWIESNRHVRSQAADGVAFDDWGTTVAGISCPTLLVHGEVRLGGLVTPSVANLISEQNRNVTCQMVPNAGHNVRRENFERFMEVVSDFLTPSKPQ